MLNKIKFSFVCIIILIFTSCSSLFLDQTPPEIVSSFPSNSAVDIQPDTLLTISFSEKMDKESVERAISLSTEDSVAVDGVFSWEGNTVSFRPLNPLDVSPEYYFKVSSSAEDADGNNLLNEFFITFSVVGHSEKPQMLWYSPDDGSYVANNTNPISIGFSTNMDIDSLQDAFSVSPSISGIISLVSNGQVLLFNPTTPFVFGTIYTVTVSSLAKDSAGNSLASDKTFSFTIGNDFVKPSLVSFSTQGGTNIIPGVDIITNISKSSTLVLTFSEDMDPSTVISAFSIEPSIEGDISHSGSNLIFTPSIALKSETLYTIKIADTASDLQGNTINSEKHIKFKTDAMDSRYLSVLEVRGETNELWTQNISVPIVSSKLTNISIIFSAPVNLFSVFDGPFSIEIVDGNNPSASGTVTHVSFESNGYIMRLDLDNIAEENIYKFMLSTDGKDIWDNPLEEDWVFYFQT